MSLLEGAVAYKSDQELIAHEHNIERFFVEKRQIAWLALIGVMLWGFYSWRQMPKRKDPEISIRAAVASCQWPGATAEQMEQLVTRPIEDTMAQNKTVHAPSADAYGLRSIVLPGVTFVTVQLSDNVDDVREQFNDINLRLAALNASLPQGAQPIQFQSDFGETAALMLTVASPVSGEPDLQLRAQSIYETIKTARSSVFLRPPATHMATIIHAYPTSLSAEAMISLAERESGFLSLAGTMKSTQVIRGAGFVGVDGMTSLDDTALLDHVKDFIQNHQQSGEIDPDVWGPVIIDDPASVLDQLTRVAGPKYSYKELDQYTDLLQRAINTASQVERVERKAVLPQRIYLDYSQQKLDALGLQPNNLSKALGGQNITAPSGSANARGTEVSVRPSGQFTSTADIGNTLVGGTANGAPVSLRDLVQASRSYDVPPKYLNTYTWRDQTGKWIRSRAVTLAVYMRSGEQIAGFGASVDAALKRAAASLPPDLILEHTSDQPLQVKESTDLFMDALYEAIFLVVLVDFIGFREWRAALLMAVCIPIALAMTFGLCHLVRIDLQQVSIATLIIALGLLVDDPVVANDSIRRGLAAGQPASLASWLGPTKLEHAIVYATITNIIAYLPFLLLTGNTGQFIYSLPVVMTAALISSRIVSMTFVPLLATYLMKPPKRKPSTMEQLRTTGFYGWYYRMAGSAIEHRWKFLTFAVALLLLGASSAFTLKTQFFPEDVQYWSYVDVWLPNQSTLVATQQTTARAEQVIQAVTETYQRNHLGKIKGVPASVALLHSMTTFLGGGGPRFWFSASPEQQQQNYAEIIVRLRSKEATPELAQVWEEALKQRIPGATFVVHQLQTNPVDYPIELRVFMDADPDPSREDAQNAELRSIGVRLEQVFRSLSDVDAVDDDWMSETSQLHLAIDSAQANLAGLSNQDIANSMSYATDGTQVGALRDGNKQIPIVLRLAPVERGQVSDLSNLYVYPSQNATTRVPLTSVASMKLSMENVRIRRMDHFRMLGVHAFPTSGVLPSEVLKQAKPQIEEIMHSLPPGYHIQIAGEQAKQEKGFHNLTLVLVISVCGIYMALLIQFENAVKPLLVFAAAPFGVVGALVALAATHTAFGFMAFLGLISLIGVIISHVIVLFDFIEEMHHKGAPLEEALRDAGIVRLRPVVITVAATVLALFPLALHGGPLWAPLCYAQIGGLLVATVVTLIIVPVLYSIVVLDLKWIAWEEVQSETLVGQ